MARMPLLTQLAMRIGRTHPLYAVAVTALERYPEHRERIPVAVADWVRWAAQHGHDPLTPDREAIAALLSEVSATTRWSRLRGLACVCALLVEDGRIEADPTVGLAWPSPRLMRTRRLTSEDLGRLVSGAVRDLDRPRRRVGAARDLVAIGLLASGVGTARELVALRWGDLDDERGRLRWRDDWASLPRGVRRAFALYRLALSVAGLAARDGDALFVGGSAASIALYHRDERPDLLPIAATTLRQAVCERLHREGLALSAGDGGRVVAWSALDWLAGAGEIDPRLPGEWLLRLPAALR